MSEEVATPAPESQPELSILDDPAAWMAQKEAEAAKAEPEEQTGQVEAPQAPVEAEPPQQQQEAPKPAPTDWREIPIPDDVAEEYRFFKGKPTGELFRSYLSATREIEAKAKENAQLQAKLAVQETLKEMLGKGKEPEAPAAPIDPYTAKGLDIDVDSVVRPREIEAVRTDYLREEARRIAREEVTQAEQQRYQQEFQRAREQAVISAAKEAGFPDELLSSDWPILMQIGDEALKNGAAPEVVASDQFYSAIIKGRINHLRSVLTPAQEAALAADPPKAPPPAPSAAANPPGAKRPAHQSEAPASSVPTLKGEKRKALETLARETGERLGWDEDAIKDFYARSAERLAKGD